MCPPCYHHNGFIATPELGHRYNIYILDPESMADMIYIFRGIYIYISYNLIIIIIFI